MQVERSEVKEFEVGRLKGSNLRRSVEHWVKHPESDEPYSFEDWINLYSAHIPGHIEQIRNNYNSEKIDTDNLAR